MRRLIGVSVAVALLVMPAIASPASCDRAAGEFQRWSKNLEIITNRWSACIDRGGKCDADFQKILKAPDEMKKRWAKVQRKCPDLR